MPDPELEPAWSQDLVASLQGSCHPQAVVLCSLLEGTDNSLKLEKRSHFCHLRDLPWGCSYQNCREGGLLQCPSLPGGEKCLVVPVLSFLGVVFSLRPMSPASESSWAVSLCCQRIIHYVCSCRRGKGRTQLSLLPRALQRQGAAPQAENGPAPGPPVTTSVATEPPKMSNADFAKLLLRK